MTTPQSSKTYDENWAEHQRLRANVDALQEQLQQAVAARDRASEALGEARDFPKTDLERELADNVDRQDARIETLREQLVAARTAVPLLEFLAGPVQGALLEQGVAPPLTLRERAEIVASAVDATKGLTDLMQTAALAGKLFTGHPEPVVVPEVRIVSEMPARADALAALDDAATNPMRGEVQEALKRAQQLLEAERRELDGARTQPNTLDPPSRLGPVVEMHERHADEQSRLIQTQAQQMDVLNQRYESRNTDPEILKGLQDRLREGQVESAQLLLERQKRELEELQRAGQTGRER